MRVILLHNPKAGNESPSANALKKLFAKAGHEITYASTNDAEWELRLSESADAIAIAGGDGTVGQVALRVAERGLPFALLPLGTANNIARSIGEDRPIERIVAALDAADVRSMDLGVVATRMGSRPFVESVGVGALAELIRAKFPGRTRKRPGDQRAAALRHLVKLAKGRRAADCELRVDEHTLCGRYLLIEILNVGWVGPNLPLAPDNSIDDGTLDVICVEAGRRRGWASYLEHLCANEEEPIPARRMRGRRVELRCANADLHIDDEVLEVAVALAETNRAALRFLR